MNVKVIIFVVWSVLLFWFGWEWRDRSADIKKLRQDVEDAATVVTHLRETLDEERTKSEKLAKVGESHEEDRVEAEKVPAAVVAGIESGDLKLRKQWAACETARLTDASTAALERDAFAELRRKDQGDLVRVGRDADDQVRACQAVIQTYREKTEK